MKFAVSYHGPGRSPALFRGGSRPIDRLLDLIRYAGFMSWTRREFLTTAGLGISATAAGVSLFSETAGFRPFPHDGPAYLVGDPYLATAEGPGLGGRSFSEARHRALRFRTPPADRDRFALGLLPEGADA